MTMPRGATARDCRSCGRPLRPVDRYCPACGTASEAPRLGEAGPSLQVPLRATADLTEERRHVTVLFADLSGSTALAASLDAEDTREILTSFFGALARRIQRYGGTVDKYIGDAVMAVFGAPVAHEDDAERALHAALAMQSAIAGLNDDLERRHGVRLALRIGVNTGEVVAGVIAGEVQAAYTVVGDTVNTAKRLEEASPLGGIVVGEATRSATSRAFEFEATPELRLKGKEALVRAYRVLGARPDARPRGLAQHRLRSPLVGRDRELAALTERVERLAAGEGAIVTLIGDAGVGKSRLIADAKRSVAALGVRWLEGRCFTVGQTLRYAPLVEAIEQDVGIGGADSEAERWAKLERRVRGLLEDADETLPYLATLLALRVPESHAGRVRSLTGEAMGRQIFLVTRRFIAALARERPLVLVFEDLHWADASTVALIQHLLPITAEAALLLCGTSRADRDTPAALVREVARRDHGARYHELRLGPLSERDSAVLIDNLLAVDDLPARFREVILRQAEGNPFYVEEVIRSFIETGLVRREEASGRWHATAELERISIPDTIQGVLMARVDRLEDELKQLLKLASVIGRSFLFRVLQAVAGARKEVEARVLRLADAELVVERRRVPDLEYMFKHVLIQEATYESILRRQRRELHREVGASIESLFAERLDDFSGVLAYHYARAEDWDKALRYLERAGDQAGRVAADDEALTHYREAMAAYAAAFGDRWDRRQRAALERKMGEALFRRGEHQQAVQYLTAALERLGRPMPRTPAAMGRAILLQLVRQIGHLLLRPLLARPREHVAVAIEERYRIYQILGWIDYYGNRARQILVAFLILNMSERTGFIPGIVQGSLGLGVICDAVGLFGLAEGYHRRGVALAERSGDRLAIGYAYLGLAYHTQRLGEWDASLAHWRRGGSVFREVGDSRRWGTSAWGIAWILQRRGEPAASRAVSEEMIRVGADGGDHQLRGWGLHLRARTEWQSGDTDAAIATLEQTIELLRPMPDHPFVAGALGDLGLCYLRRQELDRAIGVLEECHRLIAKEGLRGFIAHAHNALAEAYLARAETVAPEARGTWLASARKALKGAARHSRVEHEGEIGLLRLRGTYAWLTGDEKRARAHWARGIAAGERLGSLHDLATTHLEAGRRTGDRAHLDRAAAIFERVGAALDLAWARAAADRLASGTSIGP